ncbi:POK9 protein, partial [Panurus biarmicus]|nr:POK9 protein [Panurus biarmicus]
QHGRLSTKVGKLQQEREPQWPCSDTSHRCSTTKPPCLQPATTGSLGLDLAAMIEVTLMTPHPQKIPMGVKGPVVMQGRAVSALLLGRSSASMLGLYVLPGVIDADFTGEIMVMVHTPFPPLQINKGRRNAQLVPLEQMTKGLQAIKGQERGEKGFGSTGGLTLLTLDLSERPKKRVEVKFQGQKRLFWGLLDTGADSSIISPNCWPQQWPLQPATTTVTGVGGLTLTSRSPSLQVHIDGKQLIAIFSVVQLPPTVQCLIGRDILAQLGVFL